MPDGLSSTESHQVRFGYLESRGRRTADLTLAAIATVFLAPLLVLVALLILAVDGRPVLFRQVRIGLHGRPFTILKFRTMAAPRDEVQGLLDSGARVTRVGRALRRTSLDELPALFNIMRGEMSVVGPRPLLPQHLPLYEKSYPERSLARPGLTGLAQVSGRRNLTFSQRFDRDVEYVRRASPLVDLKIILRTVVTVLADLRRPSEGDLETVDDIGIADAIRASSARASEPSAIAQNATLQPGDDAWPAMLSSSLHDVCHLSGWSVASAPLEQGEPFAVTVGVDGRSMLVPFVRRPLDGGRWDAVSPYGYAGPAFSGDARSRDSLVQEAAEHLRSEGCVSWFLRLHPLLDTWVTSEQRILSGLREHGEVVSIDLTLDDDAFMSNLRENHRRDVRRGIAEGVQIRRGDHGKDLDTFVALHRGTMANRQAAAYHRFSPDYFAALAEGLGDNLVVLLAGVDGRSVAGVLYTFAESSGIVGYHLAASVPRPPRGATKLLILEGRRLGRERGCTRLLLGGGLGSAQDALFGFKAGFSPDRHRFRTLRLVLDPEEYARRCAAVGSDPTDLSGYFPAYRRPLGA